MYNATGGSQVRTTKNTQNTPENCTDSSNKFKWQQQQWWGMNVLFQIIKKIYTQIDSVDICEKFSEKQQNLR